MEAIKNFLVNLSDKFDAIVEPIWNKVLDFFSKEWYLVYALITIVVVLLLIPGLVTMLRKAGKFFIILLILLGIVFALWFFFVKGA